MSDENNSDDLQQAALQPDGAAPGKDLTPAAKRALQEAAARREAADKDASADKATGDPEIGGPRGAEPTRYGDWERMGRAVDF